MEHATVSSYVLKRRDYYADFLIVPAATSVAVAWLLSLHIFNAFTFTSSALAGLFAWTFLEYAIHRWFFHGFGSDEHRFHHIRPGEFIGFTPITTAIIGALAFWFLTVTFGPLIGVGLLVGLVVGYLFYLFVHDKIHHGGVRAGTYLAKLNANHDYHHFRFRVNYGVITPMWDYLFGTFQQNPARPMNER
jgi:sterol desaturase/sphingolipid hydroxylase (fatty acid hydroxylase superfamily)